MSFADDAALEREVAQNLKLGRAFVNGAGGVEVLSDCTLVLARADGAELRLRAQAVMVSEAGALCGVGLELRPFGPDVVAQLEAFASGAPLEAPAAAAPPATSAPDAAPDEGVDDARGDDALDDAAEALAAEDIASDPDDDAALDDDALDDDALDDHADDGDDAHPPRTRDLQQQAAHERMRKLSQIEQQKVARSGDLSDRVMLERLYGKAVWEGLLHNPKLTVPEVARMARKGTMPRPMVDFILDNTAWVQQASVRRALLGNPRVSSEGVLKILRATPKHELKAITKSTAYAATVRDAARKLLKV